jgi:hypothetical protein
MSSAAAICCSLITLLPGHVLPDGFVERGVEVLVFPDRAEVHYRLGLSDGQMREELTRASISEGIIPDLDAAWSRYRDLIAMKIVRGVVVRVDGEPRPLRLVSVEPWVTHHVSLQVIGCVDIEAGEKPMSIDVRDELPLGPDVRGVTRLALRGRQEVEIVECTGPANLVRAERTLIATGGAERIPTNGRIAAVFRLQTAGETDGQETATVSGRETPPLTEVDTSVPSGSGSSVTESSVATENDPRQLSPEASFWLVTVGLVFVAIGVLLTIRRLISRR